MNTQTEASTNVFDVVKQVFSVVFVIAGIAAFYHFSDTRLIYRVLGLLVVFGGVIAMLATTSWGSTIRAFIVDSQIEVRKIVWPTREETTRTTLLVFAMVSIVSLVLWLLDTFLFWGVRLLTGQGT
ncbi:MAG: preprotein translocase subunit SecE [Methylococcales bacterium]|nr:preprotein translocase subunit SecE [Methylococcales bacterium]MDD5755482.1 preprotein translocase subunit SecE [Methylococcales bacterium]